MWYVNKIERVNYFIIYLTLLHDNIYSYLYNKLLNIYKSIIFLHIKYHETISNCFIIAKFEEQNNTPNY